MLTETETAVFSRERVQDCFDEAMPLLKEHWIEIAHYKDIPLEPDFHRYKAMEDGGSVIAYSARSEGKLVGYAVFFVAQHLHYKSSKQAVQDILYVSPKHRGIGKRFIAWCDRRLKEEGIEVVYHHLKAAHNFGQILERMGYQLQDLIYSKRLDKWE